MTSIQPIESSTSLVEERNTAKTVVIGLLTAVLVIAAPIIIGSAGGNYWVRVLDFAMLYVMLALGLNVVVGFAGLLDLGYIAFYAVGAYTAALLSSPHLTSQFEWIAALAPNGLHIPFRSSCRSQWRWRRPSGSCSVRRRCDCAATTWRSSRSASVKSSGSS